MEYDIDYYLIQSRYRNINKMNNNIFPPEWYSIKNNEIKKIILQDCITNNYLIKDSIYYYDFRKKVLN